MSNFKSSSNQQNPKYDLEERTAQFAENIILLINKLPFNSINKPLIEQLMRSAGSIGANYCEADAAESKKDFKHKIGICKKESKETRHWLRLLAKANPDFKEAIRPLWKECHELLLIFSKIFSKSF